MPAARPSPLFAIIGALIALLPWPAAATESGSGRIVGSGVTKTETRAVSGFHGIGLAVDARVELRQGGSEGLSITGDDNIVPLIETVVEDGILKIRWPRNRGGSTRYKELVIVVDAKTIDSLAVAGSGELRAERLKSGDLRTSLAGAGRIDIGALEANAFRTSIDGSGNMTAAGRVESLDVSVAGSGNLAASKLESRRARISVAGSGTASVWATETLNASVAGSGDVRYVGKPQVTMSVAGSGSVKPAAPA
ncbi:MAG: head GIN domain-containing protein [Casimicrobiaceae bacterium]